MNLYNCAIKDSFYMLSGIKLILTPVFFLYKGFVFLLYFPIKYYFYMQSKNYILNGEVYNKSLIDLLQPGDLICVAGKIRAATVLQHLFKTQWSHTALFLGPEAGLLDKNGNAADTIELVFAGIRNIQSNRYNNYNISILRPKYLPADDIKKMIENIKKDNDNKYYRPINAPLGFLALINFPFIKRTSCMGFVAKAYIDIGYPISPQIEYKNGKKTYYVKPMIYHTSVDFEKSPFFDVIKPKVDGTFNYKDPIPNL